MRRDFAKLDKERAIRLYEMFCSSWILKGGLHEFPVTGDRYILDEILACGKISPEEALAIENEMRDKIPEFNELASSIGNQCQCEDTKH